MVKFDRASINGALGAVDYVSDTGDGDLVEFKITGDVAGTPFEGSDWIKTISPGK